MEEYKMIPYLFSGALAGLFIVSIFKPVTHKELELPKPGKHKFHTKTGCVQVTSEEISCSSQAISLNVINDRKDPEK